MTERGGRHTQRKSAGYGIGWNMVIFMVLQTLLKAYWGCNTLAVLYFLCISIYAHRAHTQIYFC